MPKSYENTRILYETGCFCGASDLTRTGDLLITSGVFAVFCRVIKYKNILVFNDFSAFCVLYRFGYQKHFFVTLVAKW